MHILLQESLVTERDNFYETALSYVFKLQEVNEKKKFEFVETVRFLVYKNATGQVCNTCLGLKFSKTKNLDAILVRKIKFYVL